MKIRIKKIAKALVWLGFTGFFLGVAAMLIKEPTNPTIWFTIISICTGAVATLVYGCIEEDIYEQNFYIHP